MRSTDELLRLLGAANTSNVSVGRSPAVASSGDPATAAAGDPQLERVLLFYAKNGKVKVGITRNEAAALIAAGAKIL